MDLPISTPPVMAANGVTPSETRESMSAPRERYTKLSMRLQRFIAEGGFRNGDKLPPERTLAETFGVSRSSVRDAIKILSERGLLESRQGDGTYVRSADVEPLQRAFLEAAGEEGDQFDELMELRRIFEPAIAELAATRRTEAQLDTLKITACNQQLRMYAQGQSDGCLDAEFHLRLAECTGNRMLVAMMQLINEMFGKCRAEDLRDEEWLKFSAASHMRILDALARGSADDCRRAVLDHLSTIASKHLFATIKD